MSKGFDEWIVPAVEKLSPSVVNISTVRLLRDYFFNVHPVSGMGSGVIINSKGYIVTNHHVVEDSERINVTLADGRRLSGRIVGADTSSDISIIRVGEEGLPVATLGDSDALKVGQMVIAIGNPFGLVGGPTVTTGVVSAINRNIQIGDHVYENIIQTDAAINPGNSGGPLADKDGRVIGINTAMIPFAQGIGFAIPINSVKKVVEELIAYGRVIRPWLGLTGMSATEELASYYELPVKAGVIVARIIHGSPSYKAGISEGDLIVGIDGAPIKTVQDLQKIVQKRKVGDKIEVEVVRGHQRGVVEVILTELPRS
ncbi:MAG: trypsin-like peptidase domain-containing protein [Nitrososphaerales archaeon]|nr:trypsin-like peptidase domain-containing protein [Nitrososphaerales archaeon]